MYEHVISAPRSMASSTSVFARLTAARFSSDPRIWPAVGRPACLRSVSVSRLLLRVGWVFSMARAAYSALTRAFIGRKSRVTIQ